MRSMNNTASRTDNRPLYVRRMDRERREAQAELAALKESLYELKGYLNSPKFRSPSDRQGYVNVDDVLLRLDEGSYAALVAGEKTHRPE